MALNSLIKAMTSDGVLVPLIDEYLITRGADADRGHDYVSPSSVFDCMRAQMYRILKYRTDGPNDPRTQRIFDTGHAIHGMLQGYLEDIGVLEIAECPVFDPELKLTGHCDGVLDVEKFKASLKGRNVNKRKRKFSVLEIKTINSNGFKALRGAPKENHVKQASAYAMTLEMLRSKCNALKRNTIKYVIFKRKYLKQYKEFMEGFVVGGRKFTKEQKIEFKLQQMAEIMDVLRDIDEPFDTIYFLYIDKDTQELFEKEVMLDEEVARTLRSRCREIDKYRRLKRLPPRPEGATGKSCNACRYCNYKLQCY